MELALEFAIQPARGGRGVVASTADDGARLGALPAAFRRSASIAGRRSAAGQFHRADPMPVLPKRDQGAVRAARIDARAASRHHCEALIGLFASVKSVLRGVHAFTLPTSSWARTSGPFHTAGTTTSAGPAWPPSTRPSADAYARARESLYPHPKEPTTFFISGCEGRPGRHHVWRSFDQLRARLAWTGNARPSSPPARRPSYVRFAHAARLLSRG